MSRTRVLIEVPIHQHAQTHVNTSISMYNLCILKEYSNSRQRTPDHERDTRLQLFLAWRVGELHCK
jgi:hypothetical protein